MKRTTPISIYLAGPIDGIPYTDAQDWRESIDPPNTVLLFNPVTCFVNAGMPVAAPMHTILKHVIACCDGVLANLSGPGRGIGTIREIEFAKGLNKPVTIVCPQEVEATSMMTYDLDCFRTVSDAFVGILSQIVDQRHEPHPLAMLLGLDRMPGDEDE